jgi:hypothetical protein
LFQILVVKALDPDWIPIRIGIQPKMLDPDEMNADPQPWFIGHLEVPGTQTQKDLAFFKGSW